MNGSTDATVTFGLQEMPSKGVNGRFVMLQPWKYGPKPDGTAQELQPYQVTVQHVFAPLDVFTLCASILCAGFFCGFLGGRPR